MAIKGNAVLYTVCNVGRHGRPYGNRKKPDTQKHYLLSDSVGGKRPEKANPWKQKVDERLPELGRQGSEDFLLKGSRVSVWGDENVFEVMAMFT